MLTLYNTLTRQKQEFTPLEDKLVRIYTCGPTVYAPAHIGNLRAYIFADVLRRTLEYSGYQVKHIINITDVGHLTGDRDMGEDKVEAAARQQRKSAWQIASYYTESFLDDLRALNIKFPDKFPKATDHIKEMIELIRTLEEKGYTYKTSDGIYFDTSKIAGYGKLAKLDIEGLREGARVEKNPEKKNLTDFALWKYSQPLPSSLSPGGRGQGEGEKRQMEWGSPWGVGFPGWHIECSAMAVKYLGQPIDIHTGGVDHIPVHHTNEIAQTEAATGKPLSNWWLHSEFVTVSLFETKDKKRLEELAKRYGRDKPSIPKKEIEKLKIKYLGEVRMGKSEANIMTLQELINMDFTPLAYRYLVLQAHYRSKMNFNTNAMMGAQNSLNALYAATVPAKEAKVGCAKYEKQFFKKVSDDLNTPEALAVMWEMMKSGYPPEAKLQSLLEMDKILGLSIKDTWQELKKPLSPEIKKLVDEREQLRGQKNWDKADQLREQIKSQGYQIDDTDQGPLVRKKLS